MLPTWLSDSTIDRIMAFIAIIIAIINGDRSLKLAQKTLLVLERAGIGILALLVFRLLLQLKTITTLNNNANLAITLYTVSSSILLSQYYSILFPGILTALIGASCTSLSQSVRWAIPTAIITVLLSDILFLDIAQYINILFLAGEIILSSLAGLTVAFLLHILHLRTAVAVEVVPNPFYD